MYFVSFNHPHPEDLADGRVVAPGDEVKLTQKEAEDPHNKRLIEEGILIEPSKTTTTTKEPK